jgi:hypothetical protein
LALGRGADQLPSLEALTGAALRVHYSLPGGFEWRVPREPNGSRPPSLEPSPVREQTREAALQAARRLDPQVAEAQIAPTELALTILYLPGPNSRLHYGGVRSNGTGTTNYPMMAARP